MKEGWEYKSIGELTSYFDDGDWIESADQSESGIRLIQTGNIGNGVYRDKADKAKYISEDTFERLNCKELLPGDCLVSRLPDPIGRCCIIPQLGEKMITAVDCSILRFKECIIPSFFVYSTHSSFYQNQIDKSSTGATRKRISRKNLSSIIVPIPSHSEQQHIVEELNLLSSIIEKKKSQLNELDKLAQSLFYEMFGDPVTNEKGWETTSLSTLCNVTSSKRIFANEYVEKGIPFYRSKEIIEKSKGKDITTKLFISEERYLEIKTKYGVPTKGDILVSAVGTIGEVWVVDTDEPFYFKDGNLLWLKIKDSINPLYFRFLLLLLIDEYKKKMANGAAYAALTIINLNKMVTNNIPFPLQQQFASKIKAIEKQKELINQSIKEVETLYNSRMDYYFN